jgi:polygalacturonase
MSTITLEKSGGKADGVTDNSGAFRTALESLRDAGGGVLEVGPGNWLTGPIQLYSGTTLHLDAAAVVTFIPDPELYRPVYTRWEGVECYAMQPCVFSAGCENIAITGKGLIEGNGPVWWEMLWSKRKAGQKEPMLPIELELAKLNPGYKSQPGGGGGRETQFLRPAFVQFINCKNVRLEGITVANSPFWTVHPVYCDGLVINGIIIRNPHDAPNTDGIDIDSCVNVEIVNCDVGVGDDGICLKSGSGPDGIRVNKPTANVLVKNCVVGDGHGGIVIGSETAAGLHDIYVEDCTFNATDRGIRIKTRRGRGGAIFNLVFKNLVMKDNLCPVAMNMFYRCGATLADGLFSTDAMPVLDTTPSIKNVTISGIRATGCKASAGFIVGLPEAPIENLLIENCTFETDEASGVSPQQSEMFLGIPEVQVKSVRILNAPGAQFTNVSVKGPKETFIHY